MAHPSITGTGFVVTRFASIDAYRSLCVGGDVTFIALRMSGHKLALKITPIKQVAPVKQVSRHSKYCLNTVYKCSGILCFLTV